MKHTIRQFVEVVHEVEFVEKFGRKQVTRFCNILSAMGMKEETFCELSKDYCACSERPRVLEIAGRTNMFRLRGFGEKSSSILRFLMKKECPHLIDTFFV